MARDPLRGPFVQWNRPSPLEGVSGQVVSGARLILEAGHAVAHRVVGMVCGEASIVPDYESMCGGHAITADPWLIYDAWERRDKWRGLDFKSILRGRIIGYMAEAADLSMAYLERLRLKVRPMLRRHWHEVEAVVEALLVRKTLTGPEIDAIIEKVTTPRERVIAGRIEAARQPMRDLARSTRIV